jgi:hypothetical protein
VDWQPVASTHIAQVGYEDDSRVLGIRFQDGGVYEYQNVPVELVESFLKAPSKGHFFRDRIKGQFSFERVA